MAVSEEKHCQKHAWLYDAAKEHHEEQEEMLRLKGPEERLAIEGAPGPSEVKKVKTWDYQVKNSLMYIPEGKFVPGISKKIN